MGGQGFFSRIIRVQYSWSKVRPMMAIGGIGQWLVCPMPGIGLSGR
jgi:hypothetical protein